MGDWMTTRTKRKAQRKLRGVKITIGETTPRTKEYEELKADMTGQDYMRNIFNDGEENQNNAFYSPAYNNVIIKTGLINGLFDLGFSLGFPPSLLYGGFVATTLGHELTHGLDTTGRRYGKDGNRLDWWELSDDREFMNRTECLKDQYANFTITHRGQNYT